MKKLRSALIIMWATCFHFPTPALADSIWTGGTSDFNTGSNWSAGVPTADNAVFNAASPTNINLSGSLSVSTFTFNPGAAAYNVTIPNAVTLTVQPVANALTVNSGISNNSAATQTLNINAGGALTFQGSSTAGNAVINNAGTLTFQGTTNSIYSGATAGNATIVNSGLLNFVGNSTGGNAYIVNMSTIQFHIDSSIISGSLGNAAVVNNGLIDATPIGGLSWNAGSIEGPGSIQIGGSNCEIGTNGLNTTISGVISGNEHVDESATFAKVGTGILTLTGANTFAGTTQIAQGELRVLGSWVSNTTIFSGAVLSGTGTMAEIVNHGTVAPGVNGAGHLTVARYSGAGALNIVINGTVPSLRVLGSADITGGTLTVSGSNFTAGQHDILSSNGLRGTFTAVNVPSSLFAFSPLYTPTDVLLQISFTTPFSSLAQTSNQRSVASNLEISKSATSTQFTSAITQLSLLPNAAIPSAYDQISGDSLASFQESNLQNAAAFGQGMRQRAVNVSSGSYGLWAQGMGWNESIHGDSSVGSPGMQATTGGFQAGYDYALIDHLVIGISGGYGNTSVDIRDRNSSGGTTSILSGLYAGYVQDDWFANTAAALTSGSNHMTRNIQYGTVNDQATSTFDSQLFSLSLETGYTFQPVQSLMVVPSVSLRHTHLGQDAFTESGGSGLDLAVADQSIQSVVSSLGSGLKYSFMHDDIAKGFVALTAAWEHEWNDNKNALSVRFADTSGDDSYSVQATPRARNTAAMGLQAEVPLNGHLAIVANYNALLSSAQTVQSLFGGARWTW